MIRDVIVPIELLEFAWKKAISGSLSIKPLRVGALSWKPLKSIELKAIVELLSGGLSQWNPI